MCVSSLVLTALLPAGSTRPGQSFHPWHKDRRPPQSSAAAVSLGLSRIITEPSTRRKAGSHFS